MSGDVEPFGLDVTVLTHLRGYPDELRRFSDLLKQAHPPEQTAVEFILSRPVSADSFVVSLCRLVRSGEDVVTVVEAADVLGVPPVRVLDLAARPGFPRPLAGADRYQVWRRADIAAFRRRGGAPDAG